MHKKGIGVHASHPISFIDHLVPLCQIMGIPFLCTYPWIHDLVDIYYPSMPLILAEPEDYCLDPYLKDYDVLFYVDHYRRGTGMFHFMDHVYNGQARSVCALHGNSDKKRNVCWIEKFAEEDIVLIYGPHMKEFIEEKGIWDRLSHCIFCGNYRLEYYKQHQSFFDQKIQPFLFPKNGKKTLLYAPTWTSYNLKSDWRADYSCFFEAHAFILEKIPEEFQVLVKLHPFLVHLFPEKVEKIKQQYEDREHIIFIDSCPLIYPLLSQVDAYIGDYSSIGYDFLWYNKPMFFLNEAGRDPKEDLGVYLFHCGRSIRKEEFSKFYQIIGESEQKDLEGKRRETYHYAFGEQKSLEALKSEIQRAYAS